MRRFIGPAAFTFAGFTAGITLVLSCSGSQPFENILDTVGLEETTSSAEDPESTCNTWRVFRHRALNSDEEQFDIPPGQFPFATIVSESLGDVATRYVITRRCLD